MERRSFLKWFFHGLGAAFTATLGVPALMYLLDPRNRPAPPGAFKTVGKLSELKPGVPLQAIIREVRTDAWTLHPNDVIGRVWLVRGEGEKVSAFTTICPHLGCSVNFLPESGYFQCPCHNGMFDTSGSLRHEPGKDNPAPRGMDELEVKLVVDAADPKEKLVQVKYESFTQGIPEKKLRT
jgi:Rieske Fe-S protein